MQPNFRILLISLLVAPVGGALVDVSFLRMIWIVIPVTIITTIGVQVIIHHITEGFRIWRAPQMVKNDRLFDGIGSFAIFLLLVGFNFYMLRDSLVNGPTWYRDYTLYGMQYGAKQIFKDTIPGILSEDPQTRLVVSPSWANGTELFLPFFLNAEEQSRVRLDSIEAFLFERRPLDGQTRFIMTANEYHLAISSPKLSNIITHKIINYPDGTEGFYITSLEYASDADTIFAEEKAARKKLKENTILINGEEILMRHSQIDMGQPADIFDGDLRTLMRGLEANPLIIEIYFPVPRPVLSLAADFGHMDFTVTVSLHADYPGQVVDYRAEQVNVEGEPHLEMEFNQGPGLTSWMRIEILHHSKVEPEHIHIREIKISP